jgi:hypothetical protein
MSRKLILVSLLTVAVLMVFAVAAVTVFAFAAIVPAQVEAAPVEDVLEIAPVQVEVSPKVVEPVIERASYQDGGCPYSHAKMQLTEAPAEETLEDAPLAQADLQ